MGVATLAIGIAALAMGLITIVIGPIGPGTTVIGAPIALIGPGTTATIRSLSVDAKLITARDRCNGPEPGLDHVRHVPTTYINPHR